MKKLFTLLLAIGTLCSCESDPETENKYNGGDPWWYSDIYVLGGTKPIEVENYKRIALTAEHNTVKIEILSQGISKASCQLLWCRLSPVQTKFLRSAESRNQDGDRCS